MNYASNLARRLDPPPEPIQELTAAQVRALGVIRTMAQVMSPLAAELYLSAALDQARRKRAPAAFVAELEVALVEVQIASI